MSLYSVKKLSEAQKTGKRVHSVVKAHDKSTMSRLNLTEVNDLEAWIVRNPEIISEILESSDEMKVITSQYSSWKTGADPDKGQSGKSSRQRSKKKPDILGLTNSGKLVVVELKRGEDSDIHLQAISYAAMASQFTYKSLARAHDEWLLKSRPKYYLDDEIAAALPSIVSPVENQDGIPTDLTATGVQVAGTVPAEPQSENEQSDTLAELMAWGGGDKADEKFSYPKIVLVAERFSPETITTIEWLRGISQKFDFTCLQYRAYSKGSDVQDEALVSFTVVWPTPDKETYVLGPEDTEISEQEEKVEKKRGDNTGLLLTRELPTGGYKIPDGSTVELRAEDLSGRSLSAEHLAKLEELFSHVSLTWKNRDIPPSKPLYAPQLPGEGNFYSLQGAWNEIAKYIGAVKPNGEALFRQASTIFRVNGKTLDALAKEVKSGTETLEEESED